MSGTTSTGKVALLDRRLRNYWKMEAGCAFLFPVVVYKLAWPGTLAEAVAVGTSLFASCALLLFGALYWHACWERVQGRPRPMRRALKLADRFQWAFVGMAVAGAAATTVAWSTLGWTSSVKAGAAFTLLAALEYVNYYHRQLQYFDHLPDWKRFLRRRRLRRAHLAVDLQAFRRATP